MRYNPALDGLRALAVALVVLLHCGTPGFSRGYVGVDLFFVLSGFLITSLLLDEFRSTGSIGLRNFYIRRAKRLYPALLLMLAAYVVVAPILKPGLSHARDALLAATYVTDYTVAFANLPTYLKHTWSLSVEEKFYILWPLALLAMLRRDADIPRALCWAGFVAFAWFTLNIMLSWEVAFRFDTRALGLIGGCWLAASGVVEKTTPRYAAICGVALLSLAMLPSGFGWLPLGEAAGVALVIAAVRYRHCPDWASWLGRMSYGIYLWHYPITKFMHQPWYVELAIALPASILLAWLSYITVERVVKRLPTIRDPYQKVEYSR